MKIVRNLMRTLCILVLFLLTTNCQHDAVTETQEETLQKEFPFKSSILSKQDVEANTKLSNQMRSLATLQSTSIAESVYNQTYNFTIDTDVVKFVESIVDDAHSYTFPISRENNTESALENLVFSYNTTTNDYEASLVTYHFTASQKQEFLVSKHVSTPYEITYETIAVNLSDILGENTLPCTITYAEYHIPDGSDSSHLYSTNGHIQNGCEHEGADDVPCDTYTVITIYCPVGGSSSNDSDTQSPTSPYNDTSTAGGNGTTNDNTTPTDDEIDNVITSPITREEGIKQSITDCINGIAQFNTTDATTIDVEILNQNSLTLSDWITINNYLQENDCSETAQEDVIEDLLDAYDDYQIINELEEKALCVYNKLKSSSIGFKNSIKLFDGEFPVAHLKYKNSTTLPSSTNAQTLPPSNFLINIEINENNLNRPNLSIARTLIHETIHAEMFRKILSILDNGGDLNGLTRTEWLNKLLNGDYPGIYDYYVRFGVAGMQHEQMAAHYRNIIENMLIEFQPGLSQNIYEALAWVGLQDTETWNALTDVQKAAINSTINTFNASGAEQCN